MTGLKWTWALFMGFGLALGIIDRSALVRAHEVFGALTFTILGQNLVVIVAVISAMALLWKIPLLRISWLMLFTRERPSDCRSFGDSSGENINVAPIRIRGFGAIFAALLFVNIPALALCEEKMFRMGVVDWPDAIKWSLIFGLAHCIAGVPLAAGLALSIAGLWFHWCCFEGGVALSSLHHTAYNTILVTPLVIGAVAHAIFGSRPEPEEAAA